MNANSNAKLKFAVCMINDTEILESQGAAEPQV